LWALPLTVLVGFPLWFMARAGWCGFGGCWGAEPETLQFDVVGGIALAAVCTGLVFAAVAIPPWFRPWWVRCIVALVVATVDAYVNGWGASPGPIPFLPTLPYWNYHF